MGASRSSRCAGPLGGSRRIEKGSSTGRSGPTGSARKVSAAGHRPLELEASYALATEVGVFTRPMKNLYVGAAGVIWPLDGLRRRGHAETSLDEELLLTGAELIWRAGAHGDEKG